VHSITGETIKPELIQCWFPGHHSDVGGGNADHKIQNITLAWMIDQFNSRGILDFNMDFVHNVCASTRNNLDPNWNGNKDPFDDGLLSVVWHLLGSKTRTPGQYTNPPTNTPHSVTNEYMHWSVREKMEQTKLPLVKMSAALSGFELDEPSGKWVWGKGKPNQVELPEFPLPTADSVENWLSGDWLKSQES
jgi:T6SS, Phospholipase effector Tle1-like, catalytic domain